VVMFALFSPKLLNVPSPNLNHWHISLSKIITDIKHDVE